MASIALTSKYAVGEHQFAIVDDDMVEHLSQWKWKAKPNGKRNNVYAVRNAKIDGKNVTLRMHRVVAGLGRDDPLEVDHDNHNPLDNRRSNLVPSTRSQNALNARRIVRDVSCKHCGERIVRELSSMACNTELACDTCKSKRLQHAPRSSLFVTSCAQCAKPVVARTALRKYCSDACRCRARYKAGYRAPYRIAAPTPDDVARVAWVP